MAEITFIFDFDEKETYGISVGKIDKFIDSTRRNVSFYLKEGEHQVYIEQYFPPTPCGVLRKLIDVVTLPFVGVFNILSFNSNVEWEREVCAFGLRSVLNLNVCEDAEYKITLSKSEFSWETERFSEPSIDTLPHIDAKTEYIENPQSIDICYKKYTRKLYSVLSVILILFGLIFSKTVTDVETDFLTVALGVVTVAVFLGAVLSVVKNSKKRKELLRVFETDKKRF